MLLWLNGMTNPAIKHPMETMMEQYQASPNNILPLLAEDEFFIQAKNLNTKVIDFIRKNQEPITNQLLALIVQPITEVTEENHDHVVVFPILAIEFFELDLPPLTQMMLQETSIFTLFQGLSSTSDQIHEPQWSNVQRLFALLMAKEPQITCELFFKSCKLILFLNHLQSATVNSILIQLFNPEFANFEDVKLEVIILGFKGFEIMDQMSVLNFTYLIHEIMTRYFSHDSCQQLVKYVIREETINQMFACLKQNHDQLFLAKSSAHILSLISNYYSYTMQNINIYEEHIAKKQIEENPEIAYHFQLTNDFEAAPFMKVFYSQLDLFVTSFNQILEQDNKRLRTLRLKLLEIFDNLTRISNLKLWKQMNSLKLLNQIVQIYFKYPNADIFHSIFEKLLLYILNRAISDFHPYWCLVIFDEIDLCTVVSELIVPKHTILGHVHMLANHLLWFQKELSEKLIIDGSMAKYYQQLKKIEEVILLNDKWRRVVPVINLLNQKYSVQLGSSETTSQQNIIEPQSEPLIQQKDEEIINQNAQCLFNKVKNSTQPNITSVTGDEPADFESPDRPAQTVEEEYQYENRKSPEKQKTPSPDKEEVLPLPPPTTTALPYNIEQTKASDYKFVEDVYLQQTSPQKELESTPEKERHPKKIDMMSISLQDFVRPLQKPLFNKESPTQKPNKVQDIIKKYSNMSKSVTFGQAKEEQSYSSLTRKKSMESSLRLKQLEQAAADEFKILKTNNNDEVKILTNDNLRILMVDELDKQPENDSLRNSLVNLSNVSFTSSSGKKRTIKFKQSKINNVDQNSTQQVNQAIPEEVPKTSSKSLTFSVSSSNTLHDSFISSQSCTTEEKKFRQATKKDKRFLNYIKNIK